MGTKSYVPTNEAVEALLIANSNEDYYYFYNSYYILSLIEVTNVAEKRTPFFFDFKVMSQVKGLNEISSGLKSAKNKKEEKKVLIFLAEPFTHSLAIGSFIDVKPK